MSPIEHTWLDDQDGLIIVGDVLDGLGHLEDDSIDAIVTDPPYELNFMGKSWDDQGVSFNPKTWEACLRVLKPGGYLLAFGGTRTHHRLWCAVEDVGFEVRDCLMWLYGQGWPKSLDVGKAIDKAAGAERECIGEGTRFGRGSMRNRSRVEIGYRPTEVNPEGGTPKITAPATDAAKQWDGWGTALKPAWEPILLARKPLSEKTVAANVLRWGTGALNADGCRIAGTPEPTRFDPRKHNHEGWRMAATGEETAERARGSSGRWPANVVLNEEAAAQLDEQMAGVSRFFYCAKASKKERGEGNKHPTVKPLALMRWLVRMVTPPDSVVLDPFCGSGTTLMAAVEEGVGFVGIDMSPEYCKLAKRRVKGLKK